MEKILKYVELREKEESLNNQKNEFGEKYSNKKETEITKEEYLKKVEEHSEAARIHSETRRFLQSKEGEEHLKNYWGHVLYHNQIPEWKLVNNLVLSIKGCFYESKYEWGYKGELIEYLSEKRPLQNKNIPASVIAKLGLDYLDILEVSDSVPKFMEVYCDNLFKKACEDIKKDLKKVTSKIE